MNMYIYVYKVMTRCSPTLGVLSHAYMMQYSHMHCIWRSSRWNRRSSIYIQIYIYIYMHTYIYIQLYIHNRIYEPNSYDLWSHIHMTHGPANND